MKHEKNDVASMRECCTLFLLFVYHARHCVNISFFALKMTSKGDGWGRGRWGRTQEAVVFRRRIFFSGRQTYGQDSRYDKTSKPEAGVTPGFA